MAYDLQLINKKAELNPLGFIDECDAAFQNKIEKAADMIIENLPNSQIVLLAGPSGSGKTTTSMKIRDELKSRGINSHSIAMDDYFRSRHLFETPQTPEGEPDLESPLCVDMELLHKHFTMLEKGEKIIIPKFDFARQLSLIKPWRTLRLQKNEVAIFEGIHALCDDITEKHPNAFKLYISARSDITDNGRVVFKGTWMRLMRRTVRDSLFRGMEPSRTMAMWENIRRGEKKYISPFKDKADLKIDSSFPFEVCMFKTFAMELFSTIPDGVDRYEELKSILPALKFFYDIDPSLVARDSLLREFIGGGIYE